MKKTKLYLFIYKYLKLSYVHWLAPNVNKRAG